MVEIILNNEDCPRTFTISILKHDIAMLYDNKKCFQKK